MTEQLRIDAFIKPIYEGRTFTGDHQMLVTFTLHSWIAPAETLERDDMYGRRLNDAVFTSLFDGTGGSRRLADDIAADADLFHHFSLLEREQLRASIEKAASECYWRHIRRSPSYPDYLSRIPPPKKNK